MRLNGEAETADRPVYLGSARTRLKFALVPGLGWSCFKDFILPSEISAIDHIESLGYQFTTINVDPLSSSTRNASQIRDAVLDMTDVQGEEKLVLIGYSKGVPDILETLVLYPEIVDRVAAVVSIAGAVGGSPLADGASVEIIALDPEVFTVVGLVGRSGVFPYPPNARYNLMQAIAFAGGVNEIAKPRFVRVYRRTADGQMIDASFELTGTSLVGAPNIAVKPGDIVSIEQTSRTKANLLLAEVVQLRLGLIGGATVDVWNTE